MTNLKRILRILTPFPEHNTNRKQSRATFHIEGNVILCQDVCSSLHLYKTAFVPPPLPHRYSITVSATSIIFYCSLTEIEGHALGLALFISRPLYIRFAFLFCCLRGSTKHCTAMKRLNFSDIKVITPKFASDIYNCT